MVTYNVLNPGRCPNGILVKENLLRYSLTKMALGLASGLRQLDRQAEEAVKKSKIEMHFVLAALQDDDLTRL